MSAREGTNHCMEVTVGSILDGKVTGITKFGAFVALPGGKSGLVHISNISSSYVNDVNDVLSVGQEVRVKVMNIDESNRINLSMKHARSREDSRPGQNSQLRQDAQSRSPRSRDSRPGGARAQRSAPREPQTFEDKLKQYMAESESKLSQLGRYNDRGRSRRRRGS